MCLHMPIETYGKRIRTRKYNIFAQQIMRNFVSFVSHALSRIQRGKRRTVTSKAETHKNTVATLAATRSRGSCSACKKY